MERHAQAFKLDVEFAPLLDAVVLVLFMHVGYIFLSHPFALGLDVLEDYYGGKGYILFLQALLAYLCLSSLKTTSHELGKVLQWAVFLTIVFYPYPNRPEPPFSG